MDEFYRFPLYAVFIGANLGLAATGFLQKVFEAFAIRTIVTILLFLISSAFFCIFSSLLFSNGLWVIAYLAIWLLVISYILIFILALLVPHRVNENKKRTEHLRYLLSENE